MELRKKSVKNKGVIKHLHIWDLPKKYFPKKTKAFEYKDELLRMMSNLQFTNKFVQHKARTTSYNIDSINHVRGFKPQMEEVFGSIEEFIYHYENYCHRAYSFREKLLQFINAVLPVGYDEREVNMRQMTINPVVKQAKLLHVLERFKDDGDLGKITKDRQLLTHRLYFSGQIDHYLRPVGVVSFKNKQEFKTWCDNWKKEIMQRAKLTDKFTDAIFDINHEITPRIVNYKELLKR